MFYEFTTIKGEKFTLNIRCIEYFTETKKGTLIACASGMDYDVIDTYSEVCTAIGVCSCHNNE